MTLRLVCWNLHGNNRGANADAWAYLEDEIRADIALVQEAIVPEGWSGSERTVEQNGKRKWATAVVSRSLVLRPLTSVAAVGHPHPLVGPYPGAIAAATATIGAQDVVFVSVHALVVAGYSFMNVHSILNDLVPLMGESGLRHRVVVGGDINNGDQFPARNRLLPRHRNLMDRFSSMGLTNLVTGRPLAACGCGSAECAHVRTQVPRMTISPPYQTDYVWASGSVRGTATVDEPPSGLSDHLPIVVDLEVI